ncbi:quinolinate synthase [Dehalococcoides mccartyi]|jgi:quinolinate synthetase complex, A subunit|uniref:quinolinate synthase NadA n=1 Tax=Dehalococcoides mccartyi TaxID=61435 RepID=UPI00098FC89A|nr:quinolinate synthase NadA [Dehalococcoides mccartyi]AQU06520.1 quinolinate synthase [Dehalococcoides mccartyi]AQU07960.1 quinolinate synthase [Dehalococcoides mccartyi]AQX75263.1 quinolinate synthase [Dehalococcoides mccartyi]AQY73838.1 quinolinate synthase [Dehalococcoides mccartyi]
MYRELISHKIAELKKERKAIILAHNYQLGEIQDAADFVGDSLELARKAAKVDAEVIVFCGVHFMAETAAILSPEKIVLAPEPRAGCPMADMISGAELREFKSRHPGLPVVCYVNSTAEVKAESDICCTSANAVKVVESLKSDTVLFVPDQYLGAFVKERTNKIIISWPGYCPSHARIKPEDIVNLKKHYPAARVIVHPESRPEVTALADEVLSTGQMVSYAARADVKELIVGTEIGMLYRLRKENPDKLFIPVSEQAVCANMKMTTLPKLLASLENMQAVVSVPEEIRVKAVGAVERMLRVV